MSGFINRFLNMQKKNSKLENFVEFWCGVENCCFLKLSVLNSNLKEILKFGNRYSHSESLAEATL